MRLNTLSDLMYLTEYISVIYLSKINNFSFDFRSLIYLFIKGRHRKRIGFWLQSKSFNSNSKYLM